MDSLTEALAKMNLSEECYFGEDLSNEITFLEDGEKRLEKEFDNTAVQFYYGKKIMTLSLELTIVANSEIANKLMFTVDSILDKYFAKKETLYEIGWCSGYLINKRVLNSKEFYEKYKESLDRMSCVASKSYLIEFYWLNISPNRKVYKKEGEKSTLVPFSLCKCFRCQSTLQCL